MPRYQRKNSHTYIVCSCRSRSDTADRHGPKWPLSAPAKLSGRYPECRYSPLRFYHSKRFHPCESPVYRAAGRWKHPTPFQRSPPSFSELQPIATSVYFRLHVYMALPARRLASTTFPLSPIVPLPEKPVLDTVDSEHHR